jgi:hypothetical protein
MADWCPSRFWTAYTTPCPAAKTIKGPIELSRPGVVTVGPSDSEVPASR